MMTLKTTIMMIVLEIKIVQTGYWNEQMPTRNRYKQMDDKRKHQHHPKRPPKKEPSLATTDQ